MKPAMRTLFISAILLLSLVSTCKTPAHAEDQTLEYKVKAAYLYNFTKFVSWPALSLPEDRQPINICVAGKNPFGSLLEPLTRMKTQDRSITIENIKDVRDLEKRSCQMLFISSSEQGGITELLRKSAGMHILTVSDIDGFAQHDGMIGFAIKDGKVRLEINLRAARKAGLAISAKLLEIATVIP
ncbi:MAG: YfiR family protein [Desulfurivibrionaceae bacterium]